MIGRVDHLAIVSNIYRSTPGYDEGTIRARVIEAWNYKRKFRGTGGPGDDMMLFAFPKKYSIADPSEGPIEVGDRMVFISEWGTETSPDVRVWVLRGRKSHLILADRSWKDEDTERTKWLLKWCCPLCHGSIKLDRLHRCGMEKA